MCECFGAIEDITEDAIYRETYDLLTKGINVLVPHAVWQNSDPESVKFKPELSYRNEYYGKLLPSYNAYCAFMQSKLQKGVQVNSVSMLYPIESLRYLYRFSWDGDPVSGGPSWENNNYMELGQYLSRFVNCDYTFLHPDVLLESCSVKDGVISLQNTDHDQSYKLMILPGMKVMSLNAARILKNFVLGGGTLVSVSELPTVATDPSENEELNAILCELFGNCEENLDVQNRKFGKGNTYFLPTSGREYLAEILKTTQLDTKVCDPVEGLQYIHKKTENGHLWYFAAIANDVKTEVFVSGRYCLRISDPKTRETRVLSCVYRENYTGFELVLKKGESAVVEEIH
jgi:hypothetical protein